MRKTTAALLALALSASTALADTNAGALPAGKPAGVKQADLAGNTLLFIAGIAIIGVAIGFAVSNNNSNGTTTATTTTAP